MRSWQPFPDTRPAMAAARARGAQLVIISNTDRDIIAHTLRHLEVPFDAVITAEDCHAYKPDPALFRQALEVIGTPPERDLARGVRVRVRHEPAIAAITGLDSRSRDGPIGASPSGATRLVAGPPIAVRSAPAQNVPPAPKSTAARAPVGVEGPYRVGERLRGRAVDGVPHLRAGPG